MIRVRVELSGATSHGNTDSDGDLCPLSMSQLSAADEVEVCCGVRGSERSSRLTRRIARLTWLARCCLNLVLRASPATDPVATSPQDGLTLSSVHRSTWPTVTT